MFTAIYLPSLSEGEEDPSRSGFATKEAAEEYVVSKMCSECQEERSRALAGQYDDASVYPGCFDEWIIGLTDKVQAAESFDQLMIAGG